METSRAKLLQIKTSTSSNVILLFLQPLSRSQVGSAGRDWLRHFILLKA